MAEELIERAIAALAAGIASAVNLIDFEAVGDRRRPRVTAGRALRGADP